MRSSISNFKERLRLPRLFFRQPSREEQIHGGPPLEFERPIPPAPWRGIAVVVTLIVITATAAWELYCRSLGYAPTLNDNEDLWTATRRTVQPESIVIMGDSRAWFDLDLDELQKGLGKRPVQLAIAGSTVWPVLSDLADDENFHGTIICSFVPGLFFAPPDSPPMQVSKTYVKRFHNQTPAQRAGEYLAMPLEERVAFLKSDDLSLAALLNDLPIPNRRGALVPPRFPPYFQTEDRERRARMWEKCADPESPLAKKVQQIWLAAFQAAPAADLHSKGRLSSPKWGKESRNGSLIPKPRSRKSDPAAAKSFSSGSRTAAVSRNWKTATRPAPGHGTLSSKQPARRAFTIPIFPSSQDSSVRSGRTLQPAIR